MGANTQVEQVSEKASEQANAFVRLMKSSYKVTMEAGEQMSLRALDIPADILEEMGVAGDRAKSFKQFNRKMVGGIYRGLDNLAGTVSGGVAAPVEGVSNLLGKLGRKGSREAAKLRDTAKKATKDVKKAATPAKAEKLVVKAKPKARKTTATARKARTGVAKKTAAAGKKVTSKLAA
jgi:hypothetical protein